MGGTLNEMSPTFSELIDVIKDIDFTLSSVLEKAKKLVNGDESSLKKNQSIKSIVQRKSTVHPAGNLKIFLASDT